MLFKKSFSLNSFSLKKAKGNLYSDFFQNAVNLKEAFRFFGKRKNVISRINEIKNKIFRIKYFVRYG